MANTKSALKELRKGAKREIYNKKIKDNLKTLIKKTRKAIEVKDAKAEEMVKTAIKTIDKAKQKGVIKKNTADRKKSRLQTKLNKDKK
ncbi:30S ribosomal protein S20 [Candidatus Falkowbacteria bacterium RIFOXYB2_FULL_34_18]|uniref:Small ribosomal subunit protein bS20 n=1 Tax=Candidatus Falkowbacteria bacterium RIFOXYD2_FULL_34_120 TaxID=1798007 RepID=A0A1F5TP26_9BACT|nr:MAG: 30S ribosomal protein S20 [Candidatus Falkowbacteria bacterium RIFOXYB2_FULL_34_18]OGF29067.1 MAG: 30S ribosomal protein S20 [Candidatus Falkowbacteria bacterium RIFOXYC12_FULL_34_55]OGF36123.1 MAG: 30S ribosomal protein S20 [Candidatus Falkowbacteria bacterium RIFOXYC2_FULL_34_220]OGF38575.1 MAG: 30S ribosomal protein S20 [Candidatus Falkowbacteria bacterium RIFOXYD12_FULL_34_57]OGF40752.1 MAG: 30S ribosomal protein S20 [Candidatus Falkowbacteria bacterium RIFOXYD2_FULL_34_120]